MTIDDDPSFDKEAHMDEFYPFVEPNAPPPGRMKEGRWTGQLGWRTRHGEAVVVWNIGEVSEALNVRLPDGSRGAVERTLDHGHRRSGGAGDRLWTYGDLEITADDVAFIDGPQPKASKRTKRHEPDLGFDLANDQEFLDALKEDRFALAVYAIFRNRAFYQTNGTSLWTCGDRKAARLVADLRDRGESYQDYYLRDDFREIWPDDRRHMRQLTLDQIAMLSAQIPTGFGENYEEMRSRALKSARERLAEIDDRTESMELRNLRRCLTRLGWRTETDADRDRLRRESLAKRVLVLQEMRLLMDRPLRPEPDWVPPQPLSQLAQFSVAPAGSASNWAEEEIAARFPDSLYRRLRDLAAEGRMSEVEFLDLRQKIDETRTHLD